MVTGAAGVPISGSGLNVVALKCYGHLGQEPADIVAEVQRRLRSVLCKALHDLGERHWRVLAEECGVPMETLESLGRNDCAPSDVKITSGFFEVLAVPLCVSMTQGFPQTSPALDDPKIRSELVAAMEEDGFTMCSSTGSTPGQFDAVKLYAFLRARREMDAVLGDSAVG